MLRHNMTDFLRSFNFVSLIRLSLFLNSIKISSNKLKDVSLINFSSLCRRFFSLLHIFELRKFRVSSSKCEKKKEERLREWVEKFFRGDQEVCFWCSWTARWLFRELLIEIFVRWNNHYSLLLIDFEFNFMQCKLSKFSKSAKVIFPWFVRFSTSSSRHHHHLQSTLYTLRRRLQDGWSFPSSRVFWKIVPIDNHLLKPKKKMQDMRKWKLNKILMCHENSNTFNLNWFRSTSTWDMMMVRNPEKYDLQY